MRTYQEFDLTAYNSYRLKAKCRRAFFPESDDDIRQLFADQSEKKVILGGGYNVILSKSYYDTDFVLFSGNYDKITLVGDDRILCEAGTDMKVLSEFALANGLSGLEIYYDIPSSLGGAIVMNAGAGGEDIKQLLLEVTYYDSATDSFKKLGVEEMALEYRNSFFQKSPGFIICRALLQLAKADPTQIKDKMERTKETRWAKQPREFPNAGSVFKRPPGRFVGPMIDQLGLKGFSIGGAKVSEKHSGFIVNFNDATGADILSIIDHVKSAVKKEFDVDLEVEQRII